MTAFQKGPKSLSRFSLEILIWSRIQADNERLRGETEKHGGRFLGSQNRQIGDSFALSLCVFLVFKDAVSFSYSELHVYSLGKHSITSSSSFILPFGTTRHFYYNFFNVFCSLRTTACLMLLLYGRRSLNLLMIAASDSCLWPTGSRAENERHTERFKEQAKEKIRETLLLQNCLSACGTAGPEA